MRVLGAEREAIQIGFNDGEWIQGRANASYQKIPKPSRIPGGFLFFSYVFYFKCVPSILVCV